MGPQRPLPCHREHRCTAAMAPVRALCQIEQMPWGPERPVKCRQVSQDVNGYPRVLAPGALESLPPQSASTSNTWDLGTYILEPTQYRLNGFGPERSLSNGAGLGSQRRTVPRGFRSASRASAGPGGQFTEVRSSWAALSGGKDTRCPKTPLMTFMAPSDP